MDRSDESVDPAADVAYELEDVSTPSQDLKTKSRPYKYDPAEMMDRARLTFMKQLMRLLAGVLAGVALLLMMTSFTDLDVAVIKELFIPVFTTLAAIISSVAGYYYGSTASRQAAAEDDPPSP